MSKALVIFEDENYADFYPLTLLRPVYMLRPGIRSLYERIIDSMPGYKTTLFCRGEISDLLKESVSLPVNDLDGSKYDEVVIVNGALKFSVDFAKAIVNAGESVILKSGERYAAIKLVGKDCDLVAGELESGNLSGAIDKIGDNAPSMSLEIEFYNYLWNFVDDIHRAISDDFEYFREANPDDGFLKSGENMRKEGREFPGVHIAGVEDIFISRDAEILPNVVLDASHGPIFIGSRVKIEPNTYVIGPTYVGKDSMLVGGKIDACSIGPVCRAGGEVEEAIIQGYTNKYHAGFLGHAYVGEWVNFGAMTTNSDLKNNYSSVSVSVNGEQVNSGSIKVGSFIGDFTKTAIGTMLNTGINIGLCCNLVPGGLITEKTVESFTWYSPKNKMAYSIHKALGTIERTMERRGKELTDPMRVRLTEIYGQCKDKI